MPRDLASRATQTNSAMFRAMSATTRKIIPPNSDPQAAQASASPARCANTGLTGSMLASSGNFHERFNAGLLPLHKNRIQTHAVLRNENVCDLVNGCGVIIDQSTLNHLAASTLIGKTSNRYRIARLTHAY